MKSLSCATEGLFFSDWGGNLKPRSPDSMGSFTVIGGELLQGARLKKSSPGGSFVEMDALRPVQSVHSLSLCLFVSCQSRSPRACELVHG